MDQEGFTLYLKRGGRSQNAINRCVKYVQEFERFVIDSRGKQKLADATSEDLIGFVDFVERGSQQNAKGYLWAIRYYFNFQTNHELHHLAGTMREERILRDPFLLRDFRGVNQNFVLKLKKLGICNADQMLEAGKTPDSRRKIARSTGLPESVVLEFVKLSDLARIPGVKGVRARLYYEAGIDTVEKIAALSPEELREIVVNYVAESGFDGVATLPAEAQYTVLKAKDLPRVVYF